MFRAPDGGSDDDGDVTEVPAVARQAPRMSPAIATCSPFFLRRRASSGTAPSAGGASPAAVKAPGPAVQRHVLGKLYGGGPASPEVAEKPGPTAAAAAGEGVAGTQADVGAGHDDTAPSAPPLPAAAGAAACAPEVFERLQAWAAQVCEHGHQRQAQQGEPVQQGHCYHWQQQPVDQTPDDPSAPSAPALSAAAHAAPCDPPGRELKRQRAASPTPPPVTPPRVSESPQQPTAAAPTATAAAAVGSSACGAILAQQEGSGQQEHHHHHHQQQQQQQQQEQQQQQPGCSGSQPQGDISCRSGGKRARPAGSNGGDGGDGGGPSEAKEGGPHSALQRRRRLSLADPEERPSAAAAPPSPGAPSAPPASEAALQPQSGAKKRPCEEEGSAEQQRSGEGSPLPLQRRRVDGGGSASPLHAEPPALASPVGTKRPAELAELDCREGPSGGSGNANETPPPTKAARPSAPTAVEEAPLAAAPEQAETAAQPFTDEWWSCLAHAAATDGDAAAAPMEVAGGWSGGASDDGLAPMELELEAAAATAGGEAAAAERAAAEGVPAVQAVSQAQDVRTNEESASAREAAAADELAAAHPLVSSLMHQLRRGGGLPAVLSGGLGGPLQALAARRGGWTLLTAFAAAAADPLAAGPGGGRTAAAALGLALQLQQEQEVLREQMRKEAETARQAMQQLHLAEAAAAAATTRCDALSREASGARAQARSLEAELMCSICFERPRDSVLLPCCHFVACSVCVEQMGSGCGSNGGTGGGTAANRSDGGASGGTPGRGEPKRCPVCRGAVQGQVVVHLAAAAAAEAAAQAEQEGAAAAEAAGAQEGAGDPEAVQQ